MTITRVGILGSGIMGSGIAEVAAKTGHEVVLRSRRQATADAMVASLEKSLTKQVERGKLDEDTKAAVLSRVTATDHIGALADCDLVIESVVEDLAVKTDLFRELDGVVKESAILATNTSTLPVVDMAVVTARADKVVGVHFFNPAPMMSLVEIVRPLTASDETVAAVTEFARTCGKDPVEVKDRAGFIVNALLFPYLNNAVRMLETGTASRDARPGGPRHVAVDPRRPVRGVPGPELRRRARPAAHGDGRPARSEVRPRLLRLREEVGPAGRSAT